MPLAAKAVLLVVVIAAGIFDLRYRRIPNWLTLSGILAGIGMHLLSSGRHGVGEALLGFGCSLLLYLPLYFLRGMGAGDVKLMAAVGAIAGPLNWVLIFLMTAILGGIVSFIYVLYRKRLHDTLWNVGIIVAEIGHGRTPVLRDPKLDVRSQEALRMPHGALIALGCMVFLVFGASFYA